MNNVLYISYDGMTDNLGQSQVIPYLKGLTAKGFSFTILSFEKHENFKKHRKLIIDILSQANINWHPVNYTASPPVISTLKDIRTLIKTAKQLHKKEGFEIVHCRSYIAAFAGLFLKKKYGVKFVFDMRGFWADERIDGKLWNLKNPVYRLIYKYFKFKEENYLSTADYTISLTNAGKTEIHSWKHINQNPIPIIVIPCCADFEHFKRTNWQENSAVKLKNKLNINDTDFVLTYLGSIGTWYMLDEMLDFFKELLIAKPNAKFLFISGENPDNIISKATEKCIDANKIIIQQASRNDVPAYIALSKIAIFFIKPAYSKKASSPTKMAEIMAMGIPIICNSNVGDVGQIIKESEAGLLINEFNISEYKSAINKIDDILRIDPVKIRNSAQKHFSLKQGVESYYKVYKKVLTK